MDEVKRVIDIILLRVNEEKLFFSDPTVDSGTLGVAIFYYFCAQFFDDDKFLIKAEEMVEKSISLLANITNGKEFRPRYYGDSISSIISSFGKGLLYIDRYFNNSYDFSEYYEQIDDSLEDLMFKDIKRKDYDFFSGALSSGHYFLNKQIHSNGLDVRAEINLKKIYEGSKVAAIFHNEESIYWLAPSYQDKVYLGLSHGSAMIINFWSKLYFRNIINSNDHNETEWLRNAVNFVFDSNRRYIDGYFPHKAFLDEKTESTQLSMCYGDLGVLYSLFNANKILKNKYHQTEIDNMLKSTSLRKQIPTLTYDTSILYGAAGIIHVFDYLSKNSTSNYDNTINYWKGQLINFRTVNEDFVYAFKDNDNSTKLSFSWGIIGTAITLMHSESTQLPSVNELLLIGK